MQKNILRRQSKWCKNNIKQQKEDYIVSSESCPTLLGIRLLPRLGEIGEDLCVGLQNRLLVEHARRTKSPVCILCTDILASVCLFLLSLNTNTIGDDNIILNGFVLVC